MALGAKPHQVQLDVILKTLRVALVGMAVGVVGSFVVGKAIETLLYGTASADPATFTGMILLLSAVAVVAGYLPARRAAGINPMVALRNN
jgi:ABC-type antimicrobial peptide transport system permease subunit